MASRLFRTRAQRLRLLTTVAIGLPAAGLLWDAWQSHGLDGVLKMAFIAVAISAYWLLRIALDWVHRGDEEGPIP